MNLTYGSQGSAVKKLQTALNSAGYNLDVDGIYGSKTQAAVRDYQKKNGLTVDGIAGSKTQASLYGQSTTKTDNPKKTPTKNTPSKKTPSKSDPDTTGKSDPKPADTTTSEYTYDPAEDAAYQAALKALEAAKSEGAPSYDDRYDRELSGLYDKIMNREEFSYDLSADVIYQQYRQQYARQGRTAMMDTMGQAAALTGGYASTYAQAAGQQQYDAYLQSLNEIVPDLYQAALSRYNAEGENLADQYAMLSDRRDAAYQQYQDELDAYHQNISGLQERADTLYNRGFQSWKTEQELEADAAQFAHQQAQFAYQKEQDAYEQRQDTYDRVVKIITTLGYIPNDLLDQAGMSTEEAKKWLKYYYAQQTPVSSGGSSGGGSRKRSSGGSSGSKTKKTTNQYDTLVGLLGGNLSADKKRNLIVSYYQAGKITQSQYNSLLSRYGSSSGGSTTVRTNAAGRTTVRRAAK